MVSRFVVTAAAGSSAAAVDFLFEHQPAGETRRGAHDLDDRGRVADAFAEHRPLAGRVDILQVQVADAVAIGAQGVEHVRMAAQHVAGIRHPADRWIEQREDAVVVGAVEEQGVVVRARVHRDLHAGLAAELGGAVVEFGGDGELVGARAVGHDGGGADRNHRAGERGDEIDPARGGLEVGLDRAPAR